MIIVCWGNVVGYFPPHTDNNSMGYYFINSTTELQTSVHGLPATSAYNMRPYDETKC